MTQSEFDIKVNALKAKFILLTSNLITLKQMKDPYTKQVEDRQRLLVNVISALNGYDLTDNILTDDQILITFELGICAGQSFNL